MGAMPRDRHQPPRDVEGEVESESVEGESFGFEIRCPSLTPTEAWAAVVDVRRHAAVVPLTTIDAPPLDELDVGSRVIARTALGPFGFDDVMIVRELDPGRRVVFEKVGRVLGGRVVVVVQPMTPPREGEGDTAGAVVHWSQRVELRWLPTAVSHRLVRLAAPVIGQGYRLVVRRLLARGARSRVG